MGGGKYDRVAIVRKFGRRQEQKKYKSSRTAHRRHLRSPMPAPHAFTTAKKRKEGEEKKDADQSVSNPPAAVPATVPGDDASKLTPEEQAAMRESAKHRENTTRQQAFEATFTSTPSSSDALVQLTLQAPLVL